MQYQTLLQSAILFEKFAEVKQESPFTFLGHYFDEFQRIIPEKTKLAIQSFNPPSLKSFVNSMDPKEDWNHKINKTRTLFQDVFVAVNFLINSFNSFWKKGQYQGKNLVLIDTPFEIEIPKLQTHAPLAFSITDDEFDVEPLMDLKPEEQNKQLQAIYQEKMLQVQGIFKSLEWAAEKVSLYQFNKNSIEEYVASFLDMLGSFLMDVSSAMKSHNADATWAAEIEKDAEETFAKAQEIIQSKPDEEFDPQDYTEYELSEIETEFLK